MMFEKVKKSVTLKELLLGILLTIVVVYITQSIAITVELSDVKTDYKKGASEMQIFYLGRQDGEMSERKSVTETIVKGKQKFVFNHQFFVQNIIRVDTNNIKQYKINDLKVQWNGITISSLDEEDISYYICETNGINIKKNNGFAIAGEDPYILLDIQFEKVFIALCFLLLAKCFFVFLLILFSIGKIKYLFVNKRELFIKICKIGGWTICFLLLAFTNVKVWNAMLTNENQYYYIQDAGSSYNAISTSKFSNKFVCVANEMLFLEMDSQLSEDTTGMINYTIKDSTGKIYDNRHRIVKKDIENQSIRLSVKQIGLEQGEEYEIEVGFENCSSLNIRTSGEKIILKQVFKSSYKWLYCFVLIAINICFFAFLYVYKKGFRFGGYIFLSLYIGALTIVIMPPANRDDEWRHFIRAYTLAEGQIQLEKVPLTGEEVGNIDFGENATEGYLVTIPKELSELRLVDYSFNFNEGIYNDEVNRKLCVDKLVSILKSDFSGKEERVSAAGVADRGIMNYWPQTIFIWLGGLLGIRPLFLYYFARLGQLIICTCMGGCALWIIPKTKEIIIWVLTFVPNVVLLRSSCNTDGLLIAELLLFTAIVLRLGEDRIDILSFKGVKYLLCCIVLLINIVILKLPCIIVCFALMVHLNRGNFDKILHFKNKRWRVCCVVVTTIVILIIAITLRNEIVHILFNFIPREHVEYIWYNKGAVFWLFWNKAIEQLIQLGAALNSGGVLPYGILAFLLLVFMEKKLLPSKRIVLVVSFAIYLLAIILFGYVIFPPDMGYILGISFRYLLPGVPLLALAIPNGTVKTERIISFIGPVIISLSGTTALLEWLTEFWLT